MNKNKLMQVMNMKSALFGAGKYFFGFGVAFYFSYAYFAQENVTCESADGIGFRVNKFQASLVTKASVAFSI